MRSACLTLFVTLALSAAGCQKLAESVVRAGVDEFFEDWGGWDGSRGGGGGGTDWTYSAEPTSLAFVTGSGSDNVVCYVPGSRSWDLITSYQPGEHPIGITDAGDAGLIVTTRDGLRKGGVMFVPRIDLEEAVGAAELGWIAAVGDSEVIVAATTKSGESILVRVDSTYGTVLGTTAPRPATTIAGLTVVGDMAIVAEAPLGEIVCYDLSQPTPERVVLVSGSVTSGQPAGMTIGPDGTLLVASSDEPVVQEFDLLTGIELDSFRITAPGLGGLSDIEFDATTRNYLVTAGGSALYELDRSGALLDVHFHPDLDGAASITIVAR